MSQVYDMVLMSDNVNYLRHVCIISDTVCIISDYYLGYFCLIKSEK